MARVVCVRRAASQASLLAVGALLASLATIAMPSPGVSAPLERGNAPADSRPLESAPRVTQAPEKTKLDAGPTVVGFQLASAELIHVRVRGQTEFTGDYRINPDMTISVPRLGRVSVGAMTAQELERSLADRLSASLRQDVSVAVEVVRFRPFFMTGQVTSPGSVEWRPDLTLIQAISLSGGVARPSSASDIDSPERRLLLEQARIRHSFAIAQLARVSAEKSRKESIETEQLLNSFIAKALPESRDALEAFLSRQNLLLEEQRAAHESRIAGLARERDSVLHELEAARLQSDEVKLQVVLTEQHMEGIESLKSQQLLTNSRYLEHRRTLAEIRVRYSESIQLVQRARSRYNALERDIQTVQSEREALLNDRIEVLEREIAELELTLGGPTGLMEAGMGSLSPALTYHIARRTSSGVQTLVANLFTDIFPGDVVIVSSKRRAGTTTQNGLTTGTNLPSALDETQRIMEGAVTPGNPGSGTAAMPPTTSTRRAATHRFSLQATPSRSVRDNAIGSPVR